MSWNSTAEWAHTVLRIEGGLSEGDRVVIVDTGDVATVIGTDGPLAIVQCVDDDHDLNTCRKCTSRFEMMCNTYGQPCCVHAPQGLRPAKQADEDGERLRLAGHEWCAPGASVVYRADPERSFRVSRRLGPVVYVDTGDGTVDAVHRDDLAPASKTGGRR